MVSPDSQAYRARRQAETPLIVLCRFPGPALSPHIGVELFNAVLSNDRSDRSSFKNVLEELLFRRSRINSGNYRARASEEPFTVGKMGVTRDRCPIRDIIDPGQCNSARIFVAFLKTCGCRGNEFPNSVGADDMAASICPMARTGLRSPRLKAHKEKTVKRSLTEAKRNLGQTADHVRFHIESNHGELSSISSGQEALRFRRHFGSYVGNVGQKET